MGCHFDVSSFGGPFLHFQGENIKNSGNKLRSSLGGERGAGAEFFTPILFVSPPIFPVPSWPPLEWEGRRGNRLHHCVSPFSLFFPRVWGKSFHGREFWKKKLFFSFGPHLRRGRCGAGPPRIYEISALPINLLFSVWGLAKPMHQDF